MSKQRTNRSESLWCRFVDWVNGTAEEKPEKAQSVIEETATSANSLKAECINEETKVQNADNRFIHASLSNLDEETQLNRYLDGFQEKGMKLFNRAYKVLSVLICVSIISVLLITVSYSPEFGDADSPINNEVSERYITEGLQETGAVNIVTGMILDYRAFDTFGESNVLFVAACTVLILLRLDSSKEDKKKKSKKVADLQETGNERLIQLQKQVDEIAEAEENDRVYEPKNDVILQKVATCLFPPIIIFGIYVILNGHLSPGGGFSGGAIIGAGLILYLNAFGFKKTERFFTMKTFKTVSFMSLLFYGCSKSYSFFTGANHLESGIPLGTAGNILSSGLILPLNICVGLVVACTMYGFYALFRKGGM